MDRVLPRLSIVALPALALVLAAACVSPPAARVVLPDLTVRAPTTDLALEAAGFLTEARTAIEARVPGLRTGGVEVWMQEDLDAGPFETPSRVDISGFTLRGFWHREPRMHVPVEDYRATLVHELVHALLGKDWAPLPAALEEGLADTLAVELAASPATRVGRLCAAARRPSLSFRLVYGRDDAAGSSPGGTTARWFVAEGRNAGERQASTEPRGAPLGVREVLEIEAGSVWRSERPDEVSHVYGVGYFLAERIVRRGGIARLHELCLAATRAGERKIPVEQLLAAAGVPDEAAVDALVRVELERELVRLLLASAALARFLDALSAAHPELAGWDELLDTLQPRVSIDGGAYVPLRELEGFADWLARHPYGG